MDRNLPQVLLLTMGHSDNYMGGPNLTVRLLLKARVDAAMRPYSMTAIFCDRTIQRYADWVNPAKGFTRPKASVLFLVWSLLSTVRFALHFGKALLQLRKSLIILHAHGIVPAYLCRLPFLQRYPLLLTFHGKGGHLRETFIHYPILLGTVLKKLLRHIERSAVKRANLVVFTSVGAWELFEKEYPALLHSDKVRIVHVGLDTQELDSMSPDSDLLGRYGVEEGFLLLCVAKLVEDKGVDTLIESIALLPESELTQVACLIVGRGHIEEQLRSQVDQKGLQGKVRFLSFLPREHLLGLMEAADVFVLPSRVAVFDYALLEAAMLKLPVITTATGGNLEMFDQDSAILVPPDDPEALAAAITQLMADARLRDRLAENAHQRVGDRFSLQHMFASYVAIYRELLSGIAESVRIARLV